MLLHILLIEFIYFNNYSKTIIFTSLLRYTTNIYICIYSNFYLRICSRVRIIIMSALVKVFINIISLNSKFLANQYLYKS